MRSNLFITLHNEKYRNLIIKWSHINLLQFKFTKPIEPQIFDNFHFLELAITDDLLKKRTESYLAKR